MNAEFIILLLLFARYNSRTRNMCILKGMKKEMSFFFFTFIVNSYFVKKNVSCGAWLRLFWLMFSVDYLAETIVVNHMSNVFVTHAVVI